MEGLRLSPDSDYPLVASFFLVDFFNFILNSFCILPCLPWKDLHSGLLSLNLLLISRIKFLVIKFSNLINKGLVLKNL